MQLGILRWDAWRATSHVRLFIGNFFFEAFRDLEAKVKPSSNVY